jgi:hypothetical protein
VDFFFGHCFSGLPSASLHPQYHVPATIAKEQLDKAIANAASSQDTLLHHDPSKWPTLIFPDSFRVQCHHGRHRIEAGKRFLSVNDPISN